VNPCGLITAVRKFIIIAGRDQIT